MGRVIDFTMGNSVSNATDMNTGTIGFCNPVKIVDAAIFNKVSGRIKRLPISAKQLNSSGSSL